ncbi:TonB-dependent receptor [Flavisphingomonas formosensis]|uniref:TonB-dependent receptor n=1 Tax=Flavisphingomonas formosensis TaxID=861534 RepID=UPI0012F8DAF9|nr:TonB-dependent receptor [Sphingomonas formosensis]
MKLGTTVTRIAILTGTSWLAVSAPAHAQTAAAATPPNVRETQGIQEIIVTAQRRQERNQDVPISITAFSAESIQQRNITQSQDLQASVPSLIVGANGQASRDSQTFTLRGQGATFQASPGVVVYMNEVPLPAPITLSQQGGPGNYVDLENLQVLAGPQGTLFGRNTTGGAILLVPHKPTDTLEGWVQGKYGNYNNKEIEAVLNVPVVSDKLLVRVVGAYHDRDGYTKDVIHDKDLDNTHWYSGRIGITFRPSDNFENYTMAYGAYSKFNGTGQIHKGFNIAGLQAVGFCVDPPFSPPGPSGIAVSCDYYRGLTQQANELGPRKVAPGVLQSQKTKTWGITNTSTLNFNDELTARNIVSYQKFKSFYYYDGDGTIVQQYDASLPINTRPRDYLEEFTEELQLQGSYLDKHLTFTVGGFYYDQKPAGEQGVNAIVYCPAAFSGFCAPSNASVNVRNKSKALYAQATLDFGAIVPALEGLRLTGGYRYTWDTIKGSAFSYSPVGPSAYLCSNSGDIVTSNPEAGCSFGATLHSKAPNWLIGLDYKIFRNTLIFAKVSRGYKAGGFNSYSVYPNTRTFDPEFVTSYEGGFKSDFKLGMVPARLNASYYYLNYKNIQKATGDYNPSTNASGARINAAKAHVKGVEVEATVKPFPVLELGGTFSYTDFKYTQYNIVATGLVPDCSGALPTPGAIVNMSCLPGQYVAKYIYSFHASVNQPLAGNAGTLSFFVNYAHNSDQHTEAVVVESAQPGERLKGFGLLNMSLDWNNIYGSRIDAGLYVTNATNKLYRISNTDVYQQGSLLTWATIYGEPRMYGLRLRYRFGA